MTPTQLLRTPLALTLASCTALSVQAKNQSIEEITVTAEFRETSVLETPLSVSVFNAKNIQQRQAEHMEKMLSAAPNVNFSRGASRGRFIQIRGIGERSEFVEPTNPSVGVIVDGIDFTGVSTVVTTMDIQQIEVLRGPQGTLYGANALAGLINVTSNQPGDTLNGGVSTQVGNYNTINSQAALGTPLGDSLGLRLAVQRNVSDGFIENTYLGRDDTNNIDESTFRAKLNWAITEQLQLDLTAFYADVDNGYDAFSLDNTRETLSDQPGKDVQETNAGAAKLTWANDAVTVIGTISRAISDIEYSYDEDWTNTQICDGLACDSALWGTDANFEPVDCTTHDCTGLPPYYWWYSSTDQYLREKDNTSYDVRVLSNNSGDEINWVAGIYYREQGANLLRIYTWDPDFSSNYHTENTAVYGQVDIPLTEQLSLITGLRFEQWDADYSDSDAIAFKPDDDLWGGKIVLQYQINTDSMAYAQISRGYKAGGFNPNQNLAASQRTYGTETMINYEIGHKQYWADGNAFTQVSFFYQDRSDVQSKQYLLTCPSGVACSFDDFISNVSEGSNWGAEFEFNIQANDVIGFYGSLGLLRTEYKDLNPNLANAALLEGRDQAQSPHYQFTLGSQINFTDALNMRVDIEGKDKYYLSDSHNDQSSHYALLNASLNYQIRHWQLSLWGKNLNDETYETRGFNFPNDPRKLYIGETYYQLGDPRQYGVSINYSF